MPKNNSKILSRSLFTRKAPMLVLLGVFTVALVGAPFVRADYYDEQIKAAQNAKNAANNSLSSLRVQAGSYEAAIADLQAKINTVQQQIAENQAKQADISNQIVQKQAEIDLQKTLLTSILQSMYIDGQMTTVEMLATSNNLSDFVDKQQYQLTVQTKISDMMNQITELKQQLEAQKVIVEQLIKDQQAQNTQLAADRAEQNRLLALNAEGQAQYAREINSNNARINELRQQQLAANARFIGPAGTGSACGGGYPGKWCDIPMDAVLDSWGMYNRQCVSYTAFKVAASGRNMPGWGWQVLGNANQWDDNARREGIAVDSSPRAGDVAISNAGYYGHAMYVESVNSNGTINISQYNANWNGLFSTRSNVSTSGLVFIHF